MRDEFTQATVRVIGGRAGYRCSNPACRLATIGPHTKPGKTTIIGVAAHITAAAMGGPRYDPRLTREQRRSTLNAIWLCQNCAKLADTDENFYTVKVLEGWRSEAEERARVAIAGKLERLTKGEGPWYWDAKKKTYRNPTAGTVVGPREIIAIRDQWLETILSRVRL